MEKIGLFWGSNTGNQEEATNFLTDYMKSEGYDIDLYNIADTPPAKMLEYKKLIIGCPTWHIGELQDDWDAIYEEYKKDVQPEDVFFFGDAVVYYSQKHFDYEDNNFTDIEDQEALGLSISEFLNSFVNVYIMFVSEVFIKSIS